MTAIKTTIVQHIGVDHQYEFTEADGESMAGWALSWMVKRRASDADSAALITLTTGAGDIGISGAVATVTVADDETDALMEGVYAWELKRTDPGAETVLGYGQFRLVRGVHHT